MNNNNNSKMLGTGGKRKIDDLKIVEETEVTREKKKKDRKAEIIAGTNDNITQDQTNGEKEKKKKKKKKSKDSNEEISNTLGNPITTTEIETAQQKEQPIEHKKSKKTKRKHDESKDPTSFNQTDQHLMINSQDQLTNTGKKSSSPSHSNLVEKDHQNQIDSNSLVQQDPTTSKSKKKKLKEEKMKKSIDPSPSVVQDIKSEPISNSVTSEQVKNFISSNKLSYEPPEISSMLPPVLKFEDVKVHNSLRQAFVTFQKPSIIQSAVWPVLMAGRDVVGIAETGSGKTLAFGIPALQHILNLNGDKKLNKSKSEINVLIVAPTRELAMQTETTLGEVGQLASPPIKTLCVYGGVDKFSQRKALANSGVRIVVGTPGRLLDLAQEGNLKLDQVSWLILDEADRMLDKGFENDIRAIINLCLPCGATDSKTRLTTMFSATWPTNVRRLASDFMHNPVRIIVGADELTASCSVEQTVEVLTESRGKEYKLLNTLQAISQSKNKSNHGGTTPSHKDKIIVFALYKKEAQRLYDFLIRKNYPACCIEGNMSQDKRSKSLDDFMTGKATILVATDVAARGLDIPKVEYVINVTFPLTIEDYIHRIGRTGRAGRKGKSITFFTDEDKSHAGELIKVLKDAGQVVPEALKQWGGHIKKKTHAAYGDHWKEVDLTVKAKKITFD